MEVEVRVLVEVEARVLVEVEVNLWVVEVAEVHQVEAKLQ